MARGPASSGETNWPPNMAVPWRDIARPRKDLTPVQSTVLHLIAATPGTSSAELARRTHVTPQTMHKMVTDLERWGLRPRPATTARTPCSVTANSQTVQSSLNQSQLKS